jgi:hypothetical protein
VLDKNLPASSLQPPAYFTDGLNIFTGMNPLGFYNLKFRLSENFISQDLSIKNPIFNERLKRKK